MATTNKLDYNIILKAGIAVGVYYFIVKPITEKLGLKATSEEKEAEKILEKQETKINIWQGVEAVKRAAGPKTTIKVLSYSSAATKADVIYDSLNWYGDDEERIYAVFRDLNSQTQVASIVDQYKIRHKADLLNTLRSSFNTAELNEVLKIVNQKPIGIEKIK
jgi:hypothetical protein